MSEVDVAIVGAGLSGLAAALELVEHTSHSVVVLEAKERVGGRTYNRTIAGTTVDGGAAFVGPKQTAVLDLAKKLSIETYPVRPKGRKIMIAAGEQSFGESPPLKEEDRAQLHVLLRELKELEESVNVEEPWKTPNAQELDRVSLKEWAIGRGVTSSPALRVLNMSLIPVLGSFASRMSALWCAWYFAANDGFRSLTKTEGGAQDSKFAGGSQTLSLRIAERLGDRVVLDAAVDAVTTTENGRAEIQCVDGNKIVAKYVIVACSPSETAGIRFDPELPDARDRLNRGWTMAGSRKPFIAYDRAFWREQDLSGEIVSDGPIGMTMDSGPASGEPGILLSFRDEEHLPDDPEARRDAMAAGIAEVLGDEALNVVDYVETLWTDDPWISGCVSPLPPNFIYDLWPSMNVPVGPIHWAGTETARIGCGYMDGAVRAGHRAAGEVNARLTTSSK